MPIRQENKARYPSDWKAISKSKREAAGNRCEQCRAPNGEWICRGTGPYDGQYMLSEGHTFDADTGKFLGMSRGSEFIGKPLVKVVLTVAHLDHQPENCAPENLRAWCQRCHNRYDMPMRKAGIKRRAKEAMAIGVLLSVVVLALSLPARADGITAAMLGPDVFLPCLTQAQVEATAHGDREAWPLYQLLNNERCGFAVDLASNYVPGHPRFYWDDPKPLPHQPSPVSLPAAGWMMLAALTFLGVRKYV